MKRLDIIIIVLIVSISLVSFGYYKWSLNKSYDEKEIEISVKGELFKTIHFNNTERQTITINTDLGTNYVVIEDGKVGISDADCPDKLCVKDGYISNPGEILVCLPNKVVIEIKGQQKAEFDEISY